MSIRHPGEDFFTQLHFFRAAEPRPTTAAAANGRREPPLNEPEAEPWRPAPSSGRTAGLTTRAPAVRSPRPYPCPCPRQACTHSAPAPSPSLPLPPPALSPTPDPPHRRPLFSQTSWVLLGPTQTLPPSTAPRCPRVLEPQLGLALSHSLVDLAESSAGISWASLPFLLFSSPFLSFHLFLPSRRQSHSVH